MIQPGLTSITFRNLDAATIVNEVVKAGLAGIEWGGDIHVPHGEIQTAETIAKQTRDAGLAVSSYGSYFRAGAVDHPENPAPDAVVETAQALGAPMIRVWAGNKGSAESEASVRAHVAEAIRDICERAARTNIQIGIEYHRNTLTDTAESALALIQAIDHPHCTLYWQPPNEMRDGDHGISGLQTVLPYVSNVHVFYWTPERLPLEDGKDLWQQYVSTLGVKIPRWALLEFVPGNNLDAFHDDAKSLKELLSARDLL